MYIAVRFKLYDMNTFLTKIVKNLQSFSYEIERHNPSVFMIDGGFYILEVDVDIIEHTEFIPGSRLDPPWDESIISYSINSIELFDENGTVPLTKKESQLLIKNIKL